MYALSPTLEDASPSKREQQCGPLRPAQREALLRLTNKSDFFRKLKPSVLAKLPEIAHCESKAAGTLVFSQGDAGHHSYVVLSGRVGVWVTVEKQAESSTATTPRSSGCSSASTCCNSDSSGSASSDTSSTGVESQGTADDALVSRRPSLSAVESQGAADGERMSRRPSLSAVENPRVADGALMSRRPSLSALESQGASDGASMSRRPSLSAVEIQGAVDGVQMTRRPSLSAGRRPSVSDLSKLEAQTGNRRASTDKTFVKLNGEPVPSQALSRRGSVGCRRASAVAFPVVLRRASSGQESDDDDDRSSTQVGSLGPGAIFGELALLHDQPRSATIVCTEDTELILVERADFDELLKSDIMRSKEEKAEFLQANCPGMKNLSSLHPVKKNKVLFGFEKATFPKGHVFFVERTVAHAGIFIVSSGSAELRSNFTPASSTPCSSPLPGNRSQPGARSLGVLMKGAIFGSALPGLPEVCTAVATTQCELFYSTGSNYRHMPRSVRFILREALAETMTRRMSVIEPPRSLSSTGPLSHSRSSSRPSSACSCPSTPNRSRPCTPTSYNRIVARGHPNAATQAGLAGRAFSNGASADVKVRPSSASSHRSVSEQQRLACKQASFRQQQEVARPSSACSSSSASPKRQSNGFAATVGFNADMERCRKFGGSRLRFVRNASGTRSAPSLADQMQAFRRK